MGIFEVYQNVFEMPPTVLNVLVNPLFIQSSFSQKRLLDRAS